MQNLNHLLEFDPDNPQPYTPELERVAESDIIFARDANYREEIRARARSVIEMMQHGLVVESDDEAHRVAADILAERESITPHKNKPDVILHLQAIMTEFDHEVIEDATRLRKVITNKLLLEASTAEKASERIKALELLGKISDVGLFAERSIVTIEHKTTEELQKEFEETVALLLNPETNVFEMQTTPEPKDVDLRNVKINV